MLFVYFSFLDFLFLMVCTFYFWRRGIAKREFSRDVRVPFLLLPAIKIIKKSISRNLYLETVNPPPAIRGKVLPPTHSFQTKHNINIIFSPLFNTIFSPLFRNDNRFYSKQVTWLTRIPPWLRSLRYRRPVNKRTLSTSTLKYLPSRYLLRLVKDQSKYDSFFATFK